MYRFLFIFLVFIIYIFPNNDRKILKNSKDIFLHHVVIVKYTNLDFSKVYPWIIKPGELNVQYGLLLDSDTLIIQVDELVHSDKIEIENFFGEKTTGKLDSFNLDINLGIIKLDKKFTKNQIQDIDLLWGNDPKIQSKVSIITMDDLNQISERNYIVKGYNITSDYGFTKLPVFYLQSSDNLRAGLPVFSENLIAGIFSYKDSKENLIFVPISRLRRFIEFRNESEKGFPSQGIRLEPLEDIILKEYFQLGDRKGCIITEILCSTSGWNHLQKGDILLSIEEIEPKEKCFYSDPLMGLQRMELLLTRKRSGEYRKAGDKLVIKIMRNGKEHDVNFELKALPLNKNIIERIPWKVYGSQNYFILYGLILLELNRNFLWEYLGKDWRRKVPELAYLYDNYKYYQKDNEKDKIVFISEVIPDPINIGYQDIRLKPIHKIDNTPVIDLEHLYKYVQSKRNDKAKYIILELSDKRKIFLDLNQYEESLQLVKKFNIESVTSFRN